MAFSISFFLCFLEKFSQYLSFSFKFFSPGVVLIEVSLVFWVLNMTVNWLFKLWNYRQPRVMHMVCLLGVFFNSISYGFQFAWRSTERLVLMTYYGVILLLSGYQADELKIRAQYKAIVDRYVCFVYSESGVDLMLYRIEARYPTGALWILNRVSFSFSCKYNVCFTVGYIG